MNKSPFNFLGMTGSIGRIGGIFGPKVSSQAMQSVRKRAAIQNAAIQSGIGAGQVNASNIQDLGYSKYGDITAKGFENYQGDDNLYYSKDTGRTTSRDVNNPNRSTYVLGEGESLGRAGSDSERRRRRGMIDLNPQEEQVQNIAGSMPDPSASLVNPFGLETQNAVGGAFGSLFDRQNSMGSALAKRACKYKNKK